MKKHHLEVSITRNIERTISANSKKEAIELASLFVWDACKGKEDEYQVDVYLDDEDITNQLDF